MSELLQQALIEALEDEYKARATYRLILSKFGAIRPFVNIVESEERHIQALIPLFWKYGFAVPADTWPGRVQAPASVQDACQAGVEAEIENAALYGRLLNLTQAYPDVQAVFLNLQRVSQTRHLPAFQRCAVRETQRPDVRGSGGRGQGRGCRQAECPGQNSSSVINSADKAGGLTDYD